MKKSDWQVRLGVHNKFISSQGSYFSVSDIITHKKYRKVGDGGGLDNDIALLKLNDTIYFTDKIRPACLPSAGEQYVSFRNSRPRCFDKAQVYRVTDTMHSTVVRSDNRPDLAECRVVPQFPP